MYNIDTGRNGREGGGTVHASRDGGGIIAGDGLNGKHRAGNRFAAYSVPLGDLHVGQFVVFSGHGVLLVPVRGVNIYTNGRGIRAVACRRFGFHEGPQALGDILGLDDAAITSYIAADNLTVAVNIEFRAIQTTSRSCGNLPQRNISVPSRRSRIITVLRFILYHQLTRTIIVEEGLVLAIARKSKYRPFCSIIFNYGGDLSSRCIFCDLTLKFGILPRLLRKHGVDEAQIQVIGVRVGITTRISGAISRALIALVIPHIGLYGHKELAYIGCLAVVDVGHEPLDIGERRGVHLAKAAVGNSGFENGVGVCIGSRGIGKRIAV